jgi:hypothetical protein
LPPQTNVMFATLPTLQFTCVMPERSATRLPDNHHSPPPLDAVIVFLHLTI